MELIKRILFLAPLLLSISCTNAQSPGFSTLEIQLARAYYEHGLNEKAKEKLLTLSSDKNLPDSVKAEALYWLGQITFEEGRYNTALSDWQILTEQYPNSSPAREIAERLKQLRDIIGQTANETASSLMAQAYIKNGDFWSEAKQKFTIDNSWLPNVELAIAWYDKVISEFPKSRDAEIAYQRKMFTILGWKDIGEYGSAYGVRGNPKKYIPLLVDCFTKFQNDFPTSSYLQGFRYQIGQAYWGQKNWEQARSWFQSIVENGGEGQSFYSETAKARLQKLEY